MIYSPPQTTQPLVTVSGFSKRYGRLAALEDVTFSIRRGEVLGLIGPNGAGKTTLFESIAGVLPATRGELRAGGRALSPAERQALLFFMPDGIVPWPSESVRWALDFTLGFFGGRCGDREAMVAGLQLGPFLDAPIGTLSKGKRKRALLAIGLLAPQPVLLADEPFDGLDLRQAREVAMLLRAHAVNGRTLFLSIHQIGDASRICDRFVLLSGGRLCGEGTLPELAVLAAARGATVPADDLEEVFLALT
jgi:ABC-2 type transport system ATP-binding protein